MFHFLSKVIIGMAAFIGGVFGFHNNLPSPSPLILDSVSPSITITASPTPSTVKPITKSTPKPTVVATPTPEKIYIYVTPTPALTPTPMNQIDPALRVARCQADANVKTDQMRSILETMNKNSDNPLVSQRQSLIDLINSGSGNLDQNLLQLKIINDAIVKLEQEITITTNQRLQVYNNQAYLKCLNN